MVTQEFISNLWTLVPAYKNEAVFQSHAPTSTPSASTTLTPQPSNPEKSTGTYKAPIQIIHFQTPSVPPRFRERNIMNPLEQRNVNLAMERIAVPDPRMNITGNAVTYERRLKNMDIQTAPFNYNAIFGVVGILIGVLVIVSLARRK
jgi:hypothetical protein|tara:strand:+ start:7083 stop:7523 length:441 start_codon:yes stop_codon:yes gene_type:complete